MVPILNTAGRKRSHISRNAIMKATLALLDEVGFDKLSIEGVAARAGVGKSTIYRWWSSKGALAMEAFLEEVEPSIAFIETESAHNDFIAQIRKLSGLYRGKAGKIVKEMVALGQFDSVTMQSFVKGYLEPRRAAAKAVIVRGVEHGEFINTLDPDIVVDLLYSPIFHRMLIGHAPIDEGFVDDYVSLILRAIAT